MRHDQKFTTCRRKYRSPQAQWYVSGRKILLGVGICQGLVASWCVRSSCMRQPWSYRNQPPKQPMQVHVQPCTIDMKALIRHRTAFQANCWSGASIGWAPFWPYTVGLEWKPVTVISTRARPKHSALSTPSWNPHLTSAFTQAMPSDARFAHFCSAKIFNRIFVARAHLKRYCQQCLSIPQPMPKI